jgi:hypothetical protein
VKSQSTSTDPGITTVPRSVVQVPMTDAETTDLGEVSVPVSILPAASVVYDEEEEKEEDEESGHTDDEEDVDDINLTALAKETVHTNSPTQRPQREDIWKNVSRIGKRSVGLKSL